MQCWSLRDQVWSRGQYSKGQKTRERRMPSLELCLASPHQWNTLSAVL